jgi:lipopolysaccharide/colanic/teichoic acid biosynthesis glycosyltransferase
MSGETPVVAVSPWASSPARSVVDRVLAALLSVLSFPVVVVCLAGSAVRFRASPLFVQERVGRGGTTIRVPKVRSLPVSVPSSANKYELREHRTGRWSRFLRRYHLDELPQFWAVALGSMSLVGPRPEMVGLSATFPADFVAERTSVLPGMTGAWQVSDAAGGLICEAPEFDRWYVEHASPSVDAFLMSRTISMVCGGSPVTVAELNDRFCS